MTGCRMQQACGPSRGENRRSREERQGRNELGTWQVRAEGQVSLKRGRSGSGRAMEMSVEGRTLENPKRGVRSEPESPRNQRLALVASREVNRWRRSRADARYLLRLRRRGKGQEGPVPGQIVPGTCRAGMEPRRPRGEARRPGGQVGKANDPHTSSP